jgi:hypothetical protein
MFKSILNNIVFLFKKNILYHKKNNKEKIEYYIKNSNIFIDKINKRELIEIEYSGVMELIELCDELEKFDKHREVLKLPKIPYNNLNTNTLELFFNYDGNFIENYIELHLILLEKIKSVYTIRDNLLKENFKFFSKSIEPHIIVLEKYLKVIFKL